MSAGTVSRRDQANDAITDYLDEIARLVYVHGLTIRRSRGVTVKRFAHANGMDFEIESSEGPVVTWTLRAFDDNGSVLLSLRVPNEVMFRRALATRLG